MYSLLALLLAPPFYADKSNLLTYIEDGKKLPVRNAADWDRRRDHILAGMKEVMGEFPGEDRITPLDVKYEGTVEADKYVRQKISFVAEKGDRVPAYLFVPRGIKGKMPAVLCLHPTSREFGKGVAAGLGGKPDRHYAVHLAERGYVTLAPDYVNMGEYKFDAYKNGYKSATMKGIWNHHRAVSLLASLPNVDADNIGCIGHSLGGHNALFIAVFDKRVKCVVSNCGFCSFPRYMKGNLTGWSHDGYMPLIRTVYDLKPEKMPFDFPEVVAAIAPRPLLAIAPTKDHNFDVEGVKDCISAALPVYDLIGKKEKLKAHYPESDHNFPEESRKVAYEWLDRWLMK